MPDLAPLRPEDPEHVREYRLTARLGEGGQGTVYLGESPTGARVAVKLLRADLTQDAEAMERFVREVSTTRRVSPFCTAAVLDTGVEHERPYIVSEYIDGPTLQEVVTGQGPRTGSALHRLAIGTVTALVAIHQAEIVHRDFKPSNVLLAPDGPRVIDFGIAKALDRTSTLTGTAIGTPAYMTPEQLAGDNAGSPADMFAWGCTMVFAATGSPPFGTDSLAAIFNRIMNLTPDLSAITDPALRELVGHCLAKDPAQRPTASEALMRLLGHATGASGMTGGASTGSALPAASQGILAEGSAVAAQHTGPDASLYQAGPRTDAQIESPYHSGSPYQTASPYQATPPYETASPYQATPPYQTGPDSHATYPAAAQGVSYQPGFDNHPHQSGPLAAAPHQAGLGGYPQAGSGGYPLPHGFVPHETTYPVGHGPRPDGGRRMRRIWAVVGAGLALTLVAVTITLVVRNGATDTRASDTKRVTTSPTATPTPTPSVPAIPPADRKIKLPGSSLTVHESDKDPIKLASYTILTGQTNNLYVRKTDTDEFVKSDKYRHYTPNPAGTHALATDFYYSTDNYEVVTIVDHGTGAESKVKIAKSPVYGLYPYWSPDGTKGLLTLLEAGENNAPPKPYGFAVIDVATKKAKVVRVKEKDVGDWAYFWRGDGKAIGTWAINGDTQRIRFYDPQGTILQTLLDAGTPLPVEAEEVNPSGTLIMTYCKGTEQEICTWSTVADGEPKARIPFATKRVIGWYDDNHIVAWRKRGSVHEAVVIDFKGQVKRVLATSTNAKEYEDQFMRYVRTGG
ncbi:serine/threonine protein kinase [Streptosporangium becharense]|uniref:non-specific serine/threonine protein kinase n=1 Tax=Streptosporangium becharense TaxID=1816182 RepID=A0A7W9MF43_9ACTN|nr:protein kinase [Streptosporangium becharense]MBB2912090.1 serine/threonine protein kinase [Streptosporangium becharense]MBB5818637.1 serine/threonine protein kinase [Streptosporangium becharense]